MPYPALPEGMYGSGTPIDIADGNKLWRGTDRTNGFLMRSVDGRVPALEESFARAVTAATSPIFDDGVMPWGHGLWISTTDIQNQPHTIHTGKPAVGILVGVLKFEQGWQTGNPVKNWGLPLYSRGTVIRDGLVGYKTSFKHDASTDDYAAYLRGDIEKDDPSVRYTYDEWMAMWANGADGAKLALFFHEDSGFPVVDAVVPDGTIPTLADCVFAGFAKVWEPENQAVYFELKL
jgi:hypothetical protein